MKFDNHFLDALTEKAKASPRLRMHHDLRDTTEDPCMRMLNALEPGTVVPIHRHSETSEDVICIRSCVEEVLYDAEGKEVERYRFAAGNRVYGVPCADEPVSYVRFAGERVGHRGVQEREV